MSKRLTIQQMLGHELEAYLQNATPGFRKSVVGYADFLAGRGPQAKIPTRTLEKATRDGFFTLHRGKPITTAFGEVVVRLMRRDIPEVSK
jgi:hypothetical protein